MLPEIAIIILNYNNCKDTIFCIESIFKSDYTNYKLIIVDNNSNDNSDAILSQYCIEKNIVFIQTGFNGGFSFGNNVGIKYAQKHFSAEYFWILNNDTEIPQNTLSNLVNYAQNHPKKGIIGASLYYFDNKNILQGVGGKYNKWLGLSRHIGIFETATKKYENPDFTFDYVIGASMFVNKNCLDTIGLLPEEYFLFYEELDWAQKIKQSKHWELGYCSNAIVYHKEGGSSGANVVEGKSDFADYYLFANLIKFTKKHFWYCLPSVYISIFLMSLNRLRKGKFEKFKMISKILLQGGR